MSCHRPSRHPVRPACVGGRRIPRRMRAQVAAAFVSVTALGTVPAAVAQTTRPNLLLLLADNWAYPHSSFVGDRTVRTPNFDRLAREGAFFRNAYCPVPSCSPTRASMLTGRQAHELGEAVNLRFGGGASSG